MRMIWEYGIEDLVEEDPDELNEVDESTGLFPFMAAAFYTNDMDTVYRLLLARPDVLTNLY